jgi:hypothetical protein
VCQNPASANTTLGVSVNPAAASSASSG